MRWSKMHIPTLRDDPADAGAPSHRLLLRAGYIRQLMAGHYSLLPLAQRVRLKVIEIIREEMNGIGGQELLMPVMHPAELWQTSGRWELMGDEMFRLRDRRGADLALGMTHEEIISTLATELESYRELPLEAATGMAGTDRRRKIRVYASRCARKDTSSSAGPRSKL